MSLLALDTTALSVVLLFVAVGVWSLRKRFQKHEEWSLRAQMFVLLAVMVFYLIEIPALRITLRGELVYFIFSLLGLLVAGLALYGHIAVSVISRLMVELLVPDNPAAAATPRLGPAEALERQEDWEGALHEYYILARIYPRNPMLCIRAANNLLRLNRSADAVPWFERAIRYTEKPEDNLAIVRRLCDTLEALDQPDKANEVLRIFVSRFAEHNASKTIEAELGMSGSNGHGRPPAAPIDDDLVSLEDAPIASDDERQDAP